MYVHTFIERLYKYHKHTDYCLSQAGGKKSQKPTGSTFHSKIPISRTAAQKELESKQMDESKKDIWHDCNLLLPVFHFRLLNPILHPYRIGHLYPNTGTLRGLVAIRIGYMLLQGPYVSDTGDITWCTTDYFALQHTSFALWVASVRFNKAAPTLAKGGE